MKNMRWKSVKMLLTASAAVVTAGALVAPTTALAQPCPGEESGPSKTLSQRVALQVQKLYELTENDQFQEALAGYNKLFADRGDSMTAYDRGMVYNLRANVKVSLEDYKGARADLEAALATNGLPQQMNNQLRYFIAQFQVQDEEYEAAIAGLNRWVSFAQRCNVEVPGSTWFLLAVANAQKTPPSWRDAMRPGENAVAGIDPANPNESYFQLLNQIYSELRENTKRGELLERMIDLWPGKKDYWTQLSGLYSQLRRDRDAFTVLEVAYRAGLLTTEPELKNVVQYYQYFENPYRAAQMLEREMNAGNIKRNQENLVQLSQLWTQAREHKRSIPILREAARASDDGQLYLRLGRVLLADDQNRASAQALTQALNKGGMKRDETGDAWLLLGTARLNQAGPDSVEIWASAREAFVNAQRYPKAARTATAWITYVDGLKQVYEAQEALRIQQDKERCEADQARLEQQERIRDLQNRAETEEDRALQAEFLERCTPILGLGAEGEAAGDGDEAEVEASEAVEAGEE